MVKNLLAVQETRVQSLDREDPLEEGMVTHSSILAWRIPWTEEPGRVYSPGGCKNSHTTERHTHTLCKFKVERSCFSLSLLAPVLRTFSGTNAFSFLLLISGTNQYQSQSYSYQPHLWASLQLSLLNL